MGAIASNSVQIKVNPGAEVNTSIAKAATADAAVTTKDAGKTTAAANVANAADVAANLNASVKESVASQPQQSSGVFGSNNNGGDIAKATASAQAQADKIGGLITSSKLSTSDALKVATKFDSDLKAAAGKPLTNGQMLSLQSMIDKADPANKTASATPFASPLIPTPVTAPKTPKKVEETAAPTTITIAISLGRNLDFEVSSEQDKLPQSKDSTVVIDVPTPKSSQSSAPVIHLAFNTPESKKDSTTATSSPVIRSVDSYTPKLESKTAA